MRLVLRLSLAVLAVLAIAASSGTASPFATEVVSFSGPFGGSPYDDPDSVLGKPTTLIWDSWGAVTYHSSMVYSAWNTDPDGNKLTTTLNAGSQISVKFDRPVDDHPLNPYGIDFIVFGNASFIGQPGWVEPDTNMEEYYITTGHVLAEDVTVSVSQNGVDWYTYSSGPFADSYFPTQAFAWDWDNHDWGDELDCTKAVNPNLTAADLAGLSVAEVIELYNGSAGGTGFDLAESGFNRIQYVRVTSSGGEIDGFAGVHFIPEPASLSLLAGAVGVLALRRRRQ